MTRCPSQKFWDSDGHVIPRKKWDKLLKAIETITNDSEGCSTMHANWGIIAKPKKKGDWRVCALRQMLQQWGGYTIVRGKRVREKAKKEKCPYPTTSARKQVFLDFLAGHCDFLIEFTEMGDYSKKKQNTFLKKIRAEWKTERDAAPKQKRTECTDMVIKTPPWEYLVDPKGAAQQGLAGIVEEDPAENERLRELDAARQEALASCLREYGYPLRVIAMILEMDQFHVRSKPVVI